ncbi:MAG: hypothetical protein ACI9V1_002276 [Spirosomataceae bacterium]|jgi:hypothetical protein
MSKKKKSTKDKASKSLKDKVSKPKAPKSLKEKVSKPSKKKVAKPSKIKASKAPKTEVLKPEVKVLRNISDIRSFFYKNETPIYFISATNFNLLGADEWIKGFKFICHIECFDGLHPNVFSPAEETEHDEFQSIEDINNYLLENKEVVDFIKSRELDEKNGKALFLMFDEKTEQLAQTLGLDVCFPPAKLRTSMDNKVNTNRIAEKAGVACVPYVLSKVESYNHLKEISSQLGNKLVIQLPFGDSGHTTYFINNEEDYNKNSKDIEGEDEVKVMKFIRCRGSAIEACVTSSGTIVAPLMTELVGFKELTPYKGGWCGNEISGHIFNEDVQIKAREYAQRFGDQLILEGYKGYFELDFLIDQDNNEIYLGELNPRITGASSITNHALFALADVPLFVFHTLEYMDQPFEIDVDEINERWAQKDYIDDWSQLVIKHVDDSIEYVTKAPMSGIWKMNEYGNIEYDRMDTHRRSVENENEAFFLRISKKGDYFYEGADMGILVMRGRFMTDDFELNERAKKWIKAIRGEYKSIPTFDTPEIHSKIVEIGGFKLM